MQIYWLYYDAQRYTLEMQYCISLANDVIGHDLISRLTELDITIVCFLRDQVWIISGSKQSIDQLGTLAGIHRWSCLD